MDRPKLLFESLLIVASVALGFILTEWRQRVADNDLAAQVLTNVQAEIEFNLRTLEAQIPRHQALVEGLAKEAEAQPAQPESAWLAMLRTFVAHGNPDPLPMRRAAWDAAVSSGALRLIDYEVASALSDVYVGQSALYDDFASTNPIILYRPEMFTPETRQANLETLRWALNEMVGREKLLIDSYYKKHLPTIQAAAGR